MTPYEYLRRPEQLRQEIDRIRKRTESLRRLAAGLTVRLQEVRVNVSPDPGRMQSLLAEAADGEREIRLLADRFREAAAGTALYISSLPDEKLITLLETRYLDGRTWEETARRLGYSRSSVFRFHQQALSLLPPPPEDTENPSAENILK